MKKGLLQTAIDNLYLSTGVKARFFSLKDFEGRLKLNIDGKEVEFILELKNELRVHQLLQLEKNKKQLKNLMIVANNLFPKIKEELREKEIAYLEANGNVYIKNEKIFLFVDTNKKIETKKETSNRAFTKTGLKILFHLLMDKNLVNKPQREIAETVGVGLGNIPQVINGLKEIGYLIHFNKHEYVWENRKKLLDHWINAYATELRPKLVKGKYTFKKDWQTVKLNNEFTVWGGEPAADILTDYLRPELYLLYTNEKQQDLIRNYQIVPQINGELEVLEMFWKPTGIIAPPILIYTELILSGGKRNKETAEKIYNEYIQPIL